MLRCKTVILLLSLFPFKFWQGFLVRSHVQKCKRCMSRVASRDEAKALIVRQKNLADIRDIWPAIKTGIIEPKPERKGQFSFHRKWAVAAVCIVAICIAGILILNFFPKNGPLLDQEGEARFRINSIRVGDEPATPYVYQPKDSDMILVWAEKSM